jgi:tetratricopeptide (TPR) repeat protein
VSTDPRKGRAARDETKPGQTADFTLRVPANRRRELWLILVFLIPNLWTLAGTFLYDDLPIIVKNDRLHSLSRIGEIWTHGYWPDRAGLTLYRPVTQTVWSFLWTAGDGSPWPFHALNLILGAAVVILVYRLWLDIRVGTRVAFIAALMFAVLPVHTEVTAAIVGGNELLAALFGLSAILLYRRGRNISALLLFALAVFSKESAASAAALALFLRFRDQGFRQSLPLLARDASVAAVVVGAALSLRAMVAEGPAFIPPIDNPMSLLQAPQRILTALWVQVMYLGKSLFPFTLSADYSYKQIRLVMSLADPRAWAGLALAVLLFWSFCCRPATRVGIAFWVLAFLPAANIIIPIGTMMGERLAYLPSVGLTLLMAQSVPRLPGMKFAVASIVLLFSLHTMQRNRDWRDANEFYPKLAATSPESAKAHYFLGCYKAARDDYPRALESYERAIRIFPAYPEALNNRGAALVALGRLEEAKASYRECLRFDPYHGGAAASLRALESGIMFVPQKPEI